MNEIRCFVIIVFVSKMVLLLLLSCFCLLPLNSRPSFDCICVLFRDLDTFNLNILQRSNLMTEFCPSVVPSSQNYFDQQIILQNALYVMSYLNDEINVGELEGDHHLFSASISHLYLLKTKELFFLRSNLILLKDNFRLSYFSRWILGQIH